MVSQPRRQGMQQSADMLQNRSTSLKLEKQYLLLLISLLCARHVAGDDAVAGYDARSHIWAVSGGSDRKRGQHLALFEKIIKNSCFYSGPDFLKSIFFKNVCELKSSAKYCPTTINLAEGTPIIPAEAQSPRALGFSKK